VSGDRDVFDGMVTDTRMARAEPQVPGPMSAVEVDGRGPMSQSETEAWVAQRVEEAKQVALRVSAMHDKIRLLPTDREDARKYHARLKMCEVFGIPVDADMEPTKFRAAVLYGWGLNPPEVAAAMGCLPSEVYTMMDDTFRMVSGHWRAQRMEEYFAIILRAYDYLLETVDDPEILLKMLKELRSMAGTREEGRRWEAEFELREREVRAKEREAASPYRAGLGVLPVGAVEAIDVEVIDAWDEDEDEEDHDADD